MSDLVIGLNRSTHERGRSLTTLTRRDRYKRWKWKCQCIIQIFPYNSRGIPSPMSIGGR